MLNESGMAERKFKLHVDTTRMPGGPVRFVMDRFARRVLQAVDEGYREVELTPEDAFDWGVMGRPDAEVQSPVVYPDVDYPDDEEPGSAAGSYDEPAGGPPGEGGGQRAASPRAHASNRPPKKTGPRTTGRG